jgi:LacI family transcriptional regulator
VLAAMEQLGYVANQHARSLLTGKSQVVGVLVHALGTEYAGEIIRGIEEELAAVDYDLMLYTTHRRRGKEAQYVSTITHGFAEGLLLVIPIGRESYLDALRESNFPYELVEEAIADSKSPSVGISNRKGARDAVRYLLDLGHRRIGFITDVMNLDTAVERVQGYRDALEECGVPYDPDLVQEDDFVNPQPAFVTGKFLSLASPPTAILTSSDPIAFRVMEALWREHGMRVPDDMSVVGFDDIPTASLVSPRLTTVRHPMYEMGKTATRMLLERIQNPDAPPQHIQLQTQLVVRESCSPPRQR